MNTNKLNSNKPSAKLDGLNNRYIISPLNAEGAITVGAVLRAIKLTTHVSWREIASWCGLRNQSDAFKIAYTKSLRTERARLSEYITISGDLAYFYDKDHKPVAPAATVTHVSIVNGERDIVSAVVDKAVKFATRVSLLDTENRTITLTLVANGGYLVALDNDITIQHKAKFTVDGTAKRLNALLRNVVFVGETAGEASVKITIDDNTGGASAISTTEVPILVSEPQPVSVPELVVGDDVHAELNTLTVIDPAVTVVDEDNKSLELHIAPFGCRISGFKNSIHSVEQGNMYITAGTPDAINADIAETVVYCYQENAQIAYELIYNNTKIRKYLIIAAGATEEDSGTTEENKPTADTAETDSTVLEE